MSEAGIEPALSHQKRRATNRAVRRRGRAARVSVESPGSGARRTCGPLCALRSRIGSLVSSPTMLSMPLAYPSTLDHRLGARCPTRRGVGARCSPSVTPKTAGESNTYLHMRIRRHIVEDLSLSGGASSGLELFKLSITFWLEVVDCLSGTKKATQWVALTCRGVHARTSEHTSRKGRIRCRTGAPDWSSACTA